MSVLELIGRHGVLFDFDVAAHKDDLDSEMFKARFLLSGGAGTIGQAVVQEVFKRDPKALHVVDVSENNMVEIVEDVTTLCFF